MTTSETAVETPSKVISHPSGIEWRCRECDAQTDFMHDEEPDE